MASISVFAVLLVASLSGIMAYSEKEECAVYFEPCGPVVKCCQKMICKPGKNNTYPGVCHQLFDASNEAGIPIIALKPLSVIVILASIWGLYGHLIA